MIANHIHDALGQVRRLRQTILEKRGFHGYSGPARMLSGAGALLAAAALARFVPQPDPWRHLLGWGVVLAAALVLNYGSLFYWFLFDPEVERDPLQLRPAFDAVPPLAVGAALSLALVTRRQFDLLMPVWMCGYGLAHIPYRQSLPIANYGVGLFYLLAGAACLFTPGFTFTNPWPMGLVFCAGELAGGFILHRDRTRHLAER